jgi:glycerol-3-phosphate cytidylyltransferase-like family protein
LELKDSYLREFGADVLVMGDDWMGKFDHLKTICEVVYLPRTPSISTTAIIEKTRS